MTREEAKREILFAKREVMADSWIDKAYDVAIKALEEPERKTGRWITHKIKLDGVYRSYCECTACGHTRPTTLFPLYYCPNCGADMRGAKDGKNT